VVLLRYWPLGRRPMLPGGAAAPPGSIG
jgi:hypothetical protein